MRKDLADQHLQIDNIMTNMNYAGIKLRDILSSLNYWIIAENLLWLLTPSEISFLVAVLGIQNHFPYSRKFLNPIREIEPSMKNFETKMKEGYKVIMMGPHMRRLVGRITRPKMYWRMMEGCTELVGSSNPINDVKVWVFCINPKAEEMIRKLKQVPGDMDDEEIYELLGEREEAVNTEILINAEDIIDPIDLETLDTRSDKSVSNIEMMSTRCHLQPLGEETIRIGRSLVEGMWSFGLFREVLKDNVAPEYVSISKSPLQVLRPGMNLGVSPHPPPGMMEFSFMLERTVEDAMESLDRNWDAGGLKRLQDSLEMTKERDAHRPTRWVQLLNVVADGLVRYDTITHAPVPDWHSFYVNFD